MHSTPQNDPQQILRAVKLLFSEKSVVELRCLKGKGATGGYFNDHNKLAEAAGRICEGNVYITLNNVNSALLARRANRLGIADKTTSDADILRRRWLLVDCDCQRPSGISASDLEHEAAIKKAKKIGHAIVALAWPAPILADSGNGAHLLFRIDLPNDAVSAKLVQRVLRQLAVNFDDDDDCSPCVKVDQSVFNASRICKLYGTVARKGDHTLDRPWRLSRILFTPDDIRVVTREQLEVYAGTEPPPPEPRQTFHANGKFNLREFVGKHLKVRQEGSYNGNGAIYRWKLETCPLCGESDKSAVVLQFSDGRIGYRCHHNRCCGKDWQALREHFDPGYREKISQPKAASPKAIAKVKAKKPAEIIGARPFPIDALPQVVANYVRAASTAIGCDPGFIALPLLACLARAVGNKRAIRLKQTWMELPIIWCAIIGKSGTHKTPALNMAMRFLASRQAEAIADYEVANADYEQAKALYDRAYSAWKQTKKKSEEPPPSSPKEPVCQRFFTTDITIEALAERLAAQFDGLLVTRDELAGWLGGIAEYKGGKGSDLGHWLAMWSGAPLIVDRKTGAKKFLHVPRAAVSIVGGIQPGVLQRAIGREHLQDGLCARLLMAMPEPRPVIWSEAVVDPAIEEALGETFDRFLALDPAVDEEGNPAPYALSLTPEAKEVWKDYFNRHRAELVDLDDDLAAAWSKLEAYTARFALIFQLAESDSEVDEISMQSAIQLSDWFGHEAKRVYGLFHEDDDDRETRELITWIQRHGRSVTARDLTRGPRQFRSDPEAAEAALAALVAEGCGHWEGVPSAPQGGKPTRRFILGNGGDGDRTSITPVYEEVSSPSPVSPLSKNGELPDGDCRLNGEAGHRANDTGGEVQ
ncbi:MAG: YfjI family protein [Pirellulales bacterium]